MESPNLNFSIVNAVLFGRRTICCFQAKPHIFLYHGFDTPFLRPRLYLWHFRGTAAIGKTPEIRAGNRVWRIPPCSRSGTQSDPCISSVTPSIMITTSNSPGEGERDTQSISRCSTYHYRDVRVVPRANRTFSTARNPIPCATSSTDERRVSALWRPWRSSVPAASSRGKTCCAI